MKCYLCKRKGDINLQKGRDVCNECFVKLIEKRVRKYARLNKIFSKGDKIFASGIAKYFVESFDMPVEFVSKNKANKIVVSWSMDDEANEFVSALFKGGKVKKSKAVKLLKVVTDKELKIFAKIKKLKFKANKKDKDVQKFLDNVEKKHGNIKYNLLKNIESLEEII